MLIFWWAHILSNKHNHNPDVRQVTRAEEGKTMPKDRQKVRESKRKFKGLTRGTYPRRPTVIIPDPTAWVAERRVKSGSKNITKQLKIAE